MDLENIFDSFVSVPAQASSQSVNDQLTHADECVAKSSRKASTPVVNTKTASNVAVSETCYQKSCSGKRAAYASAVPVGYNRRLETHPQPRAKKFSFDLDPFQELAIHFIDRDESVLVSAHTSAGKTVVAEYAIAKSFRDAQRVIYTSPIKALSNQKFRDLQEEFEDVGLMTGDITINPLAKCLVMTTEILRSMLYRGSEIMREVRWIVYDEIHYMRDEDRGLVWEESIVLLPHNVRYVFLSATIPNALQFAEWIAKIHYQPCHVVSTDFRPTPLVHYVFPVSCSGIYLVVDEVGRFHRDSFDKALGELTCDELNIKGGTGSLGFGRSDRKHGFRNNFTTRRKEHENQELQLVLKYVHVHDLQPCIVFAFSKVKCEKNARSLKNVDYSNSTEKSLVRDIFEAAIRSLSVGDRELPQIDCLFSMLQRGIGIHHGGLLPILKEVVEILFQEGLVKVLFATETFAIGINMPAKSVVFTESQKFDGSHFRLLTASEYTQMSGRAGRRGKDKRGTVILMIDAQVDQHAIELMLCGQSDPLTSSYHVTYNMLLNLLRVEGATPEHLLSNSFRQFQQETNVPAVLGKFEELNARSKQIQFDARLREVCILASKIESSMQLLRSLSVHNPRCVSPWLHPGRLLYFRLPIEDTSSSAKAHAAGMRDRDDRDDNFFQWGVLLTCLYQGHSITSHSIPDAGAAADEIQLKILVRCHGDEQHRVRGTVSKHGSSEIFLTEGATQEVRGCATRMFIVPLNSICEISAVCISLPSNAIMEIESLVERSLQEVTQRFNTMSRTAALCGPAWISHDTIMGHCERSSDDVDHGDTQEPSLNDPRASLPLLDLVEDLNVLQLNPDFQRYASQTQCLTQHLQRQVRDLVQQGTMLDDIIVAFDLWKEKSALDCGVAACERAISRARTTVAKEELRHMRRVLERLGHVSAETGVITLKGRAACEISTADELVATELLLSGSLSFLAVPETAAVLSCLVFVEHRKATCELLHPQLVQARECLIIATEVVLEAFDYPHIIVDEGTRLHTFNPDMMKVVYDWAQGTTFSHVLQMSRVYEGTIVRVIRRLDELLRQLAAASHVIGNSELKSKLEQASTLIKRDVVFATSLYV